MVLDSTFNKSVCLDLESFLIQRLSGDGRLKVLNRNVGISDRDYYGRDSYRETFESIFEELRKEGLFSASLREIENSDLFKLSPFKALTVDQEQVVGAVLDGLFADLEAGQESLNVIRGEPGTGKTVVAIYLMKLLSDIKSATPGDLMETDDPLSEFFLPGYPEALAGFRMGFVVPQKSLRKTVKRIFKATPGLDPSMVLTPYDVGKDPQRYDLLIVDEAHRLRHRGNLQMGTLYPLYSAINESLFGRDDVSLTQVDWIEARSAHQIFLVDTAQSVHTGDVSAGTLRALIDRAESEHRLYRLNSQMRVAAGDDYVGYVRRSLSNEPPEPRVFEGYDLRFFDDFSEMRDAVLQRDAEVGLARIVAGYAWDWVSKKDNTAFDISIDGVDMRWNVKVEDWVGSAGSVNEVGVIHTIQGYDLNYAGVIIGPDLRFDAARGRVIFDRASYKDKSAAKNSPKNGLTFNDEDLQVLVTQIYSVLLTRGIRGTYVYVCDAALREHLRPLFGGTRGQSSTPRAASASPN